MNVHTTNKWDKDFKFHVSSDLVLLLKNDIQRIVKVKSLSRARLFATPRIVACTKLLCPWDFQGKSTGVGCHLLLQGGKFLIGKLILTPRRALLKTSWCISTDFTSVVMLVQR